MAGYHTVVTGDSMASLAKQYGFVYQQLWEHPNNQQLAALRKNPNTLMAGDSVYIPDIVTREVAIATEMHHRFRRLGIPSKITLQLMEGGKPRSGVAYTIELDDGTLITGSTDDEGYVKESVQPERKWGVVTVDGRWGPERYTVQLGHLDPIEEITGVQQRLNNLGHKCDASGVLDDKTKSAVTAFQARHDLDKTGEIDDATRAKLLEVCGS